MCLAIGTHIVVRNNRRISRFAPSQNLPYSHRIPDIPNHQASLPNGCPARCLLQYILFRHRNTSRKSSISTFCTDTPFCLHLVVLHSFFTYCYIFLLILLSFKGTT